MVFFGGKKLLYFKGKCVIFELPVFEISCININCFQIVFARPGDDKKDK